MHKFTFKYKPPTDRYYEHTDVFVDGEYIGYMIPDRSSARTVGENYRFVSKDRRFPDFGLSNRKKVIDRLKAIAWAMGPKGREWFRHDLLRDTEFPMFSAGNFGLSYAASEDRLKFALVSGIDWKGVSPEGIKIVSTHTSFNGARWAFFKTREAEQTSSAAFSGEDATPIKTNHE